MKKPVDPQVSRLLKACRKAIHYSQLRYGLLIGTLDRVELLQERFPEKRVYNSTILQPFHDAFDMLVIDLWSAAKAWVGKRGLLEHLIADPALLSRRSADDCGGGRRGALIAKAINAARQELVPDEEPITKGGLQVLKERFEQGTSKLRDDRNNIRAHRYEPVRDGVELSRYAVPLRNYAAHVAFLAEHTRRASLAIEGIGFDTRIRISDTDALDWADLIFHNSVSGAVWAYTRVCRAASLEPPGGYDEVRREAMRVLEQDGSAYYRAFQVKPGGEVS